MPYNYTQNNGKLKQSSAKIIKICITIVYSTWWLTVKAMSDALKSIEYTKHERSLKVVLFHYDIGFSIYHYKLK